MILFVFCEGEEIEEFELFLVFRNDCWLHRKQIAVCDSKWDQLAIVATWRKFERRFLLFLVFKNKKIEIIFKTKWKKVYWMLYLLKNDIFISYNCI